MTYLKRHKQSRNFHRLKFHIELTSITSINILWFSKIKLQCKCLCTAAILFLVTWYANMAKWLSPRYRMRDVYRNPFTFFYRNDLSTSQRVRFDNFFHSKQKQIKMQNQPKIIFISHHSQTFSNHFTNWVW